MALVIHDNGTGQQLACIVTVHTRRAVAYRPPTSLPDAVPLTTTASPSDAGRKSGTVARRFSMR